jgi:hypothetical protein
MDFLHILRGYLEGESLDDKQVDLLLSKAKRTSAECDIFRFTKLDLNEGVHALGDKRVASGSTWKLAALYAGCSFAHDSEIHSNNWCLIKVIGCEVLYDYKDLHELVNSKDSGFARYQKSRLVKEQECLIDIRGCAYTIIETYSDDFVHNHKYTWNNYSFKVKKRGRD